MRRRFALAGLVTLLTLTQANGCSSPEERFSYGQPEMESAVIGDWTGTYTATGKAPTVLHLTVRLGAPAAKTTCGSQSFPAVKCISMSELAIDATLSTDDTSSTVLAMTGVFRVWGTDLTSGEISLATYSQAPRLQLEWSASGVATGTLTDVDGPEGTVSMTRVQR
jgi:hypothetical protein